MVFGEGRIAKSPQSAIKTAYKKGETDEFVYPTIIKNSHSKPFVDDNDSIIVFNFRPDRVRQITRAFTEKNFKKFERKKLRNIYFVCMTQYDKRFRLPVVFKPILPKNTLGEVLSKNNLRQLRIAETEKYAHVTYFLNGGREKPFKNEDRILIPSPKVATYDLQPEMSAPEVTLEVIRQIKSEKYNVIILNYANPDMVGHTGDLDAAIKACETVDICIGKVVDAILDRDGLALISGDHGNAEEMVDKNGNPHTFHTTNPVPFIITDENVRIKEKGILADIAPTILKLLDIKKPADMTGNVLLS
jgi:2,3-bisphosphoglycerate-independent phosphoglycerate mutase